MARKTTRLVVKIGTSSITGGTPALQRPKMLEFVQQIARLHMHGTEVIVVSSGAQAAGRERLGFPKIDRSVPAKQMLSAVGQSHLMHYYSELFEIYNIVVAQVLLTRDDLTNRTRYLNARDTLTELIGRHIIPIINENDTIATKEFRVGDNDNLAAMVASTLDADLLVLLTDQNGLYTADPRKDSSAKLIRDVDRIDQSTYALAGGTGTRLGTGGMYTKIEAAHIATRAGVTTVIASGTEPDVLARLLLGEKLGTRFHTNTNDLESRKRWLLTDKPHGSLTVDAGAMRVLVERKASLLPVGITGVDGLFERGEMVLIVGPDGQKVAHGLSNYPVGDLKQLCGVKSDRILEVLGYTYGDVVIHRDNMVML
ncbi:MAG: glutamate 5-kinase [Chloroflexi bacterium]|nr:glutamate 5-kinase [Chloroflexota bacterium]